MKTRNPEEDYLQKMISEGEHVHQDFKFAISDARKIARSISAFANTEGGRLLVGVKDNGNIAGVLSDEELYMIEAAAGMYCYPPVQIKSRIYKVEGKNVLEAIIEESTQKPVYALDENNRKWAYCRIADENILADLVKMNIWKHDRTDKETLISYTRREQEILTVLGKSRLTLNQCARQSHMSRKETARLLADFIRFGLVKQEFSEHTFYFRLTESEA